VRFKYFISLICIIFFYPNFSFASSLESDLAAFNLITNYELLFFGGIFVILMQAGFAVVEGGYENTYKSISALLVNYVSAVLGTLIFGFFCAKILLAGDASSEKYMNGMLHGWHWNLLFFYTLMATTITTVVGRVIPSKVPLFVNWITGLMIAGVIFPFFSSWTWGNILFGKGWLKELGFIDFAGSTVVHSTAAWIVLAGYLTLKPQDRQEILKKDLIFEDYKIFAALFGAMIAPLIFSLVLNNKIISWVEMIKGALGGLVAITASCGLVNLSSALIIGLVSGLFTIYLPRLLTYWIDSKHIREVVVVHGICGAWGTLAVSLTDNPVINLANKASVIDQSIGIAVNFVWSFGVAFLVFKLICKLRNAYSIKSLKN